MTFTDYDMQNLDRVRNAWRLTPATMRHHLSMKPNGVSSWFPARHLLYVSTKIAAGLHRKNMHLVVEMPPRHGKSELISVSTPIYHFDHWPDKNVMLTSYGAELASDFSRKTRDLMLEQDSLLNCSIRPDKKQVSHFITTEGGALYSGGVGGSITGRGGDLLILDDYIKNAEHAQSEILREKDWEWFTSTLYTRLEPDASVIILATRWNIDDIIGRIRIEFPDLFEFIKIKAICEDEDDPLGRKIGEPLWPERYDLSKLDKIKRILGTYYWEALYQQEPIAGMSGLFKGSWLFTVDIHPHRGMLRTCRFWDLAASEDTGDYTVGVLMGEDKQTGQIYILDIVRGQWSSGTVEQKVKQTVVEDNEKWPDHITRMEQEPGASGKAYVDHLARVLSEYGITGERATGDAEVRIRPFFAAAETGQVNIMRGPWVEELKTELEAFPDGKHDDQVIAIAGAYNGLKRKHLKGLTWGRTSIQVADPLGTIRSAVKPKNPVSQLVW